MAKIFYSMAGEGRGHATRVRSMVERLRHEHELILFASDDAYEFLAPRYPSSSSNVQVRRIPGLKFHYTRGRLDLTRSVACGLSYVTKLPGLVRELRLQIDAERPDLAIVDFEPALPRAARACGLPLVSLNHQHFLVACQLRSLPPHLLAYGQLMRFIVNQYHSWQDATIVSSFFRAPPRRGYHHVLQVGPLLRPELSKIEPQSGDYLLSYLRPNTPPRVLELLRAADREVRVYGLGEREPDGPLKFFPLSERTFVEDLAGCAALVGAAGNQTLGEAIYFGKPVLALPEAQHHEQLINSHFLRQMGAGDFTTVENFQPRHLSDFLRDLPALQAAADRYQGRLDGTAAALAEIERFLPAKTQRPMPTLATA
ncbi:MAG: glycosyltransferase family protein [Pirellulaceae bacterium]|nr:glycosyltransferase family protein [Pirellulaceae bacterium]